MALALGGESAFAPSGRETQNAKIRACAAFKKILPWAQKKLTGMHLVAVWGLKTTQLKLRYLPDLLPCRLSRIVTINL